MDADERQYAEKIYRVTARRRCTSRVNVAAHISSCTICVNRCPSAGNCFFFGYLTSGFPYRYRDLVGPRSEWIKQIVVDSQVYFASPADFNDPFDCRVRFRTDGSLDALRQNLNQLLRERGYSRE